MNNSHPNESLSSWSDTVSMPTFDSLSHDIEVDACIVGGGVAGLTTAYLLMKEGKRVAIIESFELGSGQTGRTTAHLSNILADRYFNLEKFHGEKGARMIIESHRAAIHKIEQIVREEKIECDFEKVNGFLFMGADDNEQTIQREQSTCHRLGLDVRVQDALPIKGFKPRPSLRFSDQAQIHPLKYIRKLAELLQKGGALIFTRTFVDQIEGGEKAFVKTRDDCKVHCKSIVVATNSPINDVFAIHTKQAPYRTYAMAFQVPEGKMQNALYWDTSEPYHYARLEGLNILIVGGEDHKTGQESHPEMHYQKLEDWTRAHFSFAGEVLYQWSGQVMQSMDGLAFLGHNPMDRENVYVITGDTGNGFTHATIGAMLITDQIQGRENQWEKLYNPSRISFRALPAFLRENSNVAAQYIDWLTPKLAVDLEHIPYGQGQVFRYGAQMVAAYKDESGYSHLTSAACPHLGGIVSWNSAEKSWDCPCHGSRFDGHGRVIEGPAISDLKKLSFDEGDLSGEKIPLMSNFINAEGSGAMAKS
jgi:glycine/D-amino acid oxidase-like deaminating enzyme/nitrite reductase/ring-hydroxylating ferredoxin subunit